MLDNAASAGSQRSDRVRFVQVQIRFVLFLELDDFLQVDNAAFHRIDPLDDDNDLLVWTKDAFLAGDDRVPQFVFEVGHVVVLVDDAFCT